MTVEIRIARSSEYQWIDGLLPSAFNRYAKIVIAAEHEGALVGAGWLEALPRQHAQDFLRMNLTTVPDAPGRQQIRDALLQHICITAADWGAGGVVLGGRQRCDGPHTEALRNTGFQPSNAIEIFDVELDRLEGSLESTDDMSIDRGWTSREPTQEDVQSIRSLFSSQGAQATRQANLVLQARALSRVLIEQADDDKPRLSGIVSIRRTAGAARPFEVWFDPERAEGRARFLLADVLPSWRTHGVQSLEFRCSTSDTGGTFRSILNTAGLQPVRSEAFWIMPVENFPGNE